MQLLEGDKVITGRLELNRSGSYRPLAWLVDEQGRPVGTIDELMFQLAGQKVQVTQYRDDRGRALATVFVATPGGMP